MEYMYFLTAQASHLLHLSKYQLPRQKTKKFQFWKRDPAKFPKLTEFPHQIEERTNKIHSMLCVLFRTPQTRAQNRRWLPEKLRPCPRSCSMALFYYSSIQFTYNSSFWSSQFHSASKLELGNGILGPDYTAWKLSPPSDALVEPPPEQRRIHGLSGSDWSLAWLTLSVERRYRWDWWGDRSKRQRRKKIGDRGDSLSRRDLDQQSHILLFRLKIKSKNEKMIQNLEMNYDE